MLYSYLKQMNIEYAGNMGGKGIKTDPKYKTAEEYQTECCRRYQCERYSAKQTGVRNC